MLERRCPPWRRSSKQSEAALGAQRSWRTQRRKAKALRRRAQASQLKSLHLRHSMTGRSMRSWRWFASQTVQSSAQGTSSTEGASAYCSGMAKSRKMSTALTTTLAATRLGTQARAAALQRSRRSHSMKT